LVPNITVQSQRLTHGSGVFRNFTKNLTSLLYAHNGTRRPRVSLSLSLSFSIETWMNYSYVFF